MIQFEKEPLETQENEKKETPSERQSTIKKGICIKVIGVGGAGGNTINTMIENFCETDSNVEFIAANTDAQALNNSLAETTIQLGAKSTKGMGTGSNPDLGKRAAEEEIEKIENALGDANIVFLVAGLGGGTGSGALPVLAHVLKEKNILSVAVVTKPFLFEGNRRMSVANDSLEEIKKYIDTLIVVPNQKLLETLEQNISLVEAFGQINTITTQFVQSIWSIITRPGHINVDFADMKAIMKDRGHALMGTARAHGENRAEIAAQEAISSPLLENMDITGAQGVLMNISGSSNLGLHEVSQAASLVYEKASPDAHIILGSVIDDSLGDDVVVTIIATGFDSKQQHTSATHEIKLKPTCYSPEKEEKIEEPKSNLPRAQEDDLEIPALVRQMMQEKENHEQ